MGESSRRSPATARCYHDGMAAPDSPLINIDPEILGGEPVFMGTRVPVVTLPEWLAGGYSLDDFLDNFPSVSREQALQFLAESTELMLERHGAPAA